MDFCDMAMSQCTKLKSFLKILQFDIMLNYVNVQLNTIEEADTKR